MAKFKWLIQMAHTNGKIKFTTQEINMLTAYLCNKASLHSSMGNKASVHEIESSLDQVVRVVDTLFRTFCKNKQFELICLSTLSELKNSSLASSVFNQTEPDFIQWHYTFIAGSPYLAIEKEIGDFLQEEKRPVDMARSFSKGISSHLSKITKALSRNAYNAQAFGAQYAWQSPRPNGKSLPNTYTNFKALKFEDVTAKACKHCLLSFFNNGLRLSHKSDLKCTDIVDNWHNFSGPKTYPEQRNLDLSNLIASYLVILGK